MVLDVCGLSGRKSKIKTEIIKTTIKNIMNINPLISV
jgi:hypothetical protein